MKTGYYLLCIAVMALTTYIIRVTPMVIFRKKINNVFIKSFLYYVLHKAKSELSRSLNKNLRFVHRA